MATRLLTATSQCLSKRARVLPEWSCAYCGKSEVATPETFMAPDVRERLKSMDLIDEIDGGLVITDEGLRRIELGK